MNNTDLAVAVIHESNREFFSKPMCEHRGDLSHSYKFDKRVLMITTKKKEELFFTWDNEYRLTFIGSSNKDVTEVTDRDEFEYLKDTILDAEIKTKTGEIK